MKSEWRSEVGRFREWAAARTQQDIEWEIEYPRWETLYGSVLKFLRDSNPQLWNSEEIADLLYILWHYWDFESREDLYQMPEAALVLATHSLELSEPDMRLQLAEVLGHLPADPRIEPLLLRFMDDEVEVVRRYALEALARIDSPQCETLALREWNRKSATLQWARMMALWVWRRMNSPLLESHLLEAEVSPYAYLSYFAQNLRNGEVDLV